MLLQAQQLVGQEGHLAPVMLQALAHWRTGSGNCGGGPLGVGVAGAGMLGGGASCIGEVLA